MQAGRATLWWCRVALAAALNPKPKKSHYFSRGFTFSCPYKGPSPWVPTALALQRESGYLYGMYEIRNIGLIPRGSVLTVKVKDGMPTHEDSARFKKALVNKVGHADFTVIVIPDGWNISWMDEGQMLEAGWRKV